MGNKKSKPVAAVKQPSPSKKNNDAVDNPPTVATPADNNNPLVPITTNISSSQNVYEAVLELLTAGYLRESQAPLNTMPSAVIKLCALWLQPTLSIHSFHYYADSDSLPLQIWMEGDYLNLLKPPYIKRYEIKYQGKKLSVSNIYPFQCVAFTGFGDIDCGCGRVSVQIVAYDQNDKILAESPAMNMYANVNSVTIEMEGDYEKIEAFWREHMVDGRQTNEISIQEWIALCDKHDSFNNWNTMAVVAQRMFYLVLFLNGRKHDEDKVNVMYLKDFQNFVSDGSYGEYNGDVHRCLVAFRRLIRL